MLLLRKFKEPSIKDYCDIHMVRLKLILSDLRFYGSVIDQLTECNTLLDRKITDIISSS